MTFAARWLGAVVEVVVGYALVRVRFWPLVRRDAPRGVRAVRGWASLHPRPAKEDPMVVARRLGYAVTRVVPLMPGESRCLIRSVVLTALLTRRGVDSRLVIGVRPGDQFLAHAWVEVGDEALLPPQSALVERLVEL